MSTRPFAWATSALIVLATPLLGAQSTPAPRGTGRRGSALSGAGASVGAGGGNMSWNSTHPVKGCSAEDFYLEDVHGGLFYCFAAD
jgi:hypothetical protein